MLGGTMPKAPYPERLRRRLHASIDSISSTERTADT